MPHCDSGEQFAQSCWKTLEPPLGLTALNHIPPNILQEFFRNESPPTAIKVPVGSWARDRPNWLDWLIEFPALQMFINGPVKLGPAFLLWRSCAKTVPAKRSAVATREPHLSVLRGREKSTMSKPPISIV